MDDIYEAWKPLRNALNKLDVIDALGVIRAYSAWDSLNSKIPMPTDIEVDPAFYNEPHMLLPWDLETLAREVVVVCGHQSTPRATMKRWNTLADTMNKLKAIEEHIAQHHISGKNVMQELTVRMAHRQFRYQTEKPNKVSMVRYAKIFDHASVRPIVQRATGLSTKQLFTLGAGLWINYATKNLGMFYPLETLNITGISQTDYDKFMGLYALPLAELKAKVCDPAERKLDDAFMYQYHSLHAYPLIFSEIDGRPAHICPLPTLLYWRITAGLYYDLCKERGFDQAFGTSFQDYIGEGLSKTFKGGKVKVYPEEPDTRPKRCDWVISQAKSFMLVECKTKRMTLGARITLKDDKELFEQLNTLGDALVQAYQALESYKTGSYQPRQYPYDSAKKPFVCVVTLEKWYLLGPQLEMLREIVKDKLQNLGLDSKTINQVPYVVLSADEFECLAYLAKSIDFGDIVRPYWDDQELSRWEFGVYMGNQFKSELSGYEYPFASEVNTIFTKRIIPQVK